jgi:hypothetical protein
MKVEVDHREKDYFLKQECYAADVVFGGDHGAHMFCAVLCFIFRNTNNVNIPPLSIVITIFNIDCAQENRTILEKTIVKPMNDGLWQINGNYFTIHCNEHGNTTMISDEHPTLEVNQTITPHVFLQDLREIWPSSL